jgi:hypothetical protein
LELFGLLFALVLVVIILAALREPLRRLFFEPRWDFFASHRSKDQLLVLEVASRLRKRNYRVWVDVLEIDEDEAQAGLFRRPVSKGLQLSTCILLFTSEEYCKSDHCRQEADLSIKRFARQPRHIIEIRLGENPARTLFKIPPASACIDFKFEAGRNKEEQLEAVVDEIISQTGLAIAR